MRHHLPLVLASFLVVGALSSCPTHVDLPPDQQPFVLHSIFFTTNNAEGQATLMRIDANGNNPTNLTTFDFASPSVSEMKLDPDYGHLYLNSAAAGIFRTDASGGNTVLLVGNMGPDDDAHTTGLFLDLLRRRMYWCSLYEGYVQHASMDGTSIQLVTTPFIARAIAIDLQADEIYYGSSYRINFSGANTLAELVRTDLAGSNPRFLTDDFGYPASIALDLYRKYVYLVDPGGAYSGGRSFYPAIYRMKLDGSRITRIVDFGSDVFGSGPRPYDIAIDFKTEKLYWTRNSLNPLEGRIQRANLDGSNIEDVLILPQAIYGLALAPGM